MDNDLTRLPDEGPKASLLSAGQSFGQYRVIRLLGRGGMGEVYEMEHLTLGTRHAIKLINREIAERPNAKERFKREAKVMAQLRHPNIVHVDDFGEHEGAVWLRMELVGSGPGQEVGSEAHGLNLLEDLMTDEPLPEDLVVSLLKQVLEGLDHAHQQGVVHRDLKPSNILLQPSDLKPNSYTPKICDFGLVSLVGADWLQSQVKLTVARSMAHSADSGQADLDATRLDVDSGSVGTSTQALLGTFAYMSPEQKKGSEVDVRSDLYSIGLIAFQMLTGEETPGLEMPSDLVEGIHPAWDGWIRQSLASRPERRFADAKNMLGALPTRGLQTTEEPLPQEQDEAKPVAINDLGETYEEETAEESVDEDALEREGKVVHRQKDNKGLMRGLYVLFLVSCIVGVAYLVFKESGEAVSPEGSGSEVKSPAPSVADSVAETSPAVANQGSLVEAEDINSSATPDPVIKEEVLGISESRTASTNISLATSMSSEQEMHEMLGYLAAVGAGVGSLQLEMTEIKKMASGLHKALSGELSVATFPQAEVAAALAEAQARAEAVQASSEALPAFSEGALEKIGAVISMQSGVQQLGFGTGEADAIRDGFIEGATATEMTPEIEAKMPAFQEFIQKRMELAQAALQSEQEVAQDAAKMEFESVTQEWSKKENFRVVLETIKGKIEIELFPKQAPLAVANFVSHIENGYYDGLIFHRVIDSFMIQGGDPLGTGTGGESIWGKPFPDEFEDSLRFDQEGLLAMANSGPMTNGSQFFITTSKPKWLNDKHTIFGKVVDGYNNVEKIEKVKTGARDKPIEEQKIIRAYIK